MKKYSIAEINQFDKQYKVNLINSISGAKPASLIGTKSDLGLENVALFSSIMHLGSSPALLGFIQRPVGEFSHTYKNIKSTGFYTINHVHQSFVEKAHKTADRLPVDFSEFDFTGLGVEYLDKFQAPFVAESKIKIAMKFVKEMPIELNNTILIIGEIIDIYIDEDAIQHNGGLDLSITNNVMVSGMSTYYEISKILEL